MFRVTYVPCTLVCSCACVRVCVCVCACYVCVSIFFFERRLVAQYMIVCGVTRPMCVDNCLTALFVRFTHARTCVPSIGRACSKPFRCGRVDGVPSREAQASHAVPHAAQRGRRRSPECGVQRFGVAL